VIYSVFEDVLAEIDSTSTTAKQKWCTRGSW
jgi:hypothetical protein